MKAFFFSAIFISGVLLSAKSLAQKEHHTEPLPPVAAYKAPPLDRFFECRSDSAFWEEWRQEILNNNSPRKFQRLLTILHFCLAGENAQAIKANPKLLSQNPESPGCLDRSALILRLRTTLGESPHQEKESSLIRSFKDFSQAEEERRDSTLPLGITHPKVELIRELINTRAARLDQKTLEKTIEEKGLTDALHSADGVGQNKALQTKKITKFHQDLLDAVKQVESYQQSKDTKKDILSSSLVQYDTLLNPKTENARPFSGAKTTARVTTAEGHTAYYQFNHMRGTNNLEIAIIEKKGPRTQFSVLDRAFSQSNLPILRKHQDLQLTCIECHFDGNVYPLLKSSQSGFQFSEQSSEQNIDDFNKASDKKESEDNLSAFTAASDTFDEFGVLPFGNLRKSDLKALDFCAKNIINPPLKLNKNEWDAFSTAMNCTRCHASSQSSFPIYNQFISIARNDRGGPPAEINATLPAFITELSLENFTATLNHHIQNDSMPSDLKLSPPLKDALQECLLYLYFGPLYKKDGLTDFKGALIESLTEIKCQ